MKLILGLMPYNSSRRYLYSIEFSSLSFGIVETKKWNSKIKSIPPAGWSAKVPIIICAGETDGRKIFLSSARYKLRYVSPAAFRRMVLEKFRFMIVEEPRRYQPKRIFRLLEDANKNLHNYFIITSRGVYGMGFEPPNLTITKYILFKYTVVFIS